MNTVQLYPQAHNETLELTEKHGKHVYNIGLTESNFTRSPELAKERVKPTTLGITAIEISHSTRSLCCYVLILIQRNHVATIAT